MIPLALRLARRELRGGVRGLRIVLACLALGVAAIAAVGSLRAGIEQGLAEQGSQLLGGDLEVEGGSQPLPDTLRTWLQARGARLSDVETLRTMLTAGNGQRALVELKAVDAAWPMAGAASFDPPQSVAAALAPQNGPSGNGVYGLAVDRLLLPRLGLAPGSVVTLGQTSFVVRAVLTNEPDRVANPAVLGPRVLVSAAALPATALIQPGAFVDHRLRAVLARGQNAEATADALRAAFPNAGWRLRTARNASPGLLQFIDQTSLFMTLVGLTSLLVGGIGVANGVRAWLEARAPSVAILRCVGASAGLVFAVCAIQVMALSAAGVAIGLVVGALLPFVAAAALHNMLPVQPVTGIFAAPLIQAAAYGLLTAASFALWPLARAMQIAGAALFRDALQPTPVRLRGSLLAINVALGAALVALTVATAANRGFAIGFCVTALATLALFRAGGWAVSWLAARLPASRAPWGRSPWARLGIGNLHRPGNATPLMLMSLGLGLSTLASVALIQGNISGQISEQMPRDAPSFFFIDIQNDQMDQFRTVLAGQPGVSDIAEVPSLRARLVAVDGVPADQVHATPDTSWALRGDRGLTYAGAEPNGTRLVAGKWWPADYAGPPLVSFDASLAKGWGVHIGSVIRVNVLGRDIDLRVENLRDIAWRTLGLNFTMVASPGLLEHAPHTHIATVRVTPDAQAGVLRAVTDAMPNVSGIRVADVLAAVSTLLGQLGAALAATGSITLAAGGLVLAGAVAAGQRRRIHEAVILKSVGATRAQIRGAWLVEFGVLGVVAGLIAGMVGTAASFAVMHYVMHTDWLFLPGTLAVTVFSCVALMLAFGYAGTALALRAKVAPLLRNE